MGIDLLGPFPRTKRGNIYVLTMVDSFTHWPEFVALPDSTATSVAQAFFESIICRHGCPKRLLSDRGVQFLSNLVKSICNILNVKQAFTSGYHPQTNGQTERIHRFIGAALRIFVGKLQEDWDLYLQTCAFAYRSSMIDGTNFTPFFLLHGREPKLPEDVIYGPPVTLSQDHARYASDLTDRLKTTYATLQAVHRELRRTQKDLYDAKHQPSTFAVGDLVLLYRPARQIGLATKLLTHWIGPFSVVAKIRDELYTIEDPTTKKRQNVHTQRLARYYPYTDPIVPDPVNIPNQEEPTADDPPPTYKPGDLTIISDIDRKDLWHVAKILDTDDTSGELTVHFFCTYNTRSSHELRCYKPVYVDPTDGNEVFTHRPLPRYQALSTIITADRVLLAGFTLTKRGSLPKATLRALAQHKHVDFTYP